MKIEVDKYQFDAEIIYRIGPAPHIVVITNANGSTTKYMTQKQWDEFFTQKNSTSKYKYL